jgi:hypothetical protein
LGVKAARSGTNRNPRYNAGGVFPDGDHLSGIVVLVAVKDPVGDITGVKIAAALSLRKGYGIKGLEQRNIGCVLIVAVLHGVFSLGTQAIVLGNGGKKQVLEIWIIGDDLAVN